MTVLCYKAFIMLKVLYVGTPGRLQPHPPTDKQGSKKPQVLSAGRERLASSGKLRALHVVFCAYLVLGMLIVSWFSPVS